jgi:hypothetical protein
MICLFAQMNGTLSDHVSKTGAMSWAFLEAMKSQGNPTYKEAGHGPHRLSDLTDIIQALHLTRTLLKASEYTQVNMISLKRLQRLLTIERFLSFALEARWILTSR